MEKKRGERNLEPAHLTVVFLKRKRCSSVMHEKAPPAHSNNQGRMRLYVNFISYYKHFFFSFLHVEHTKLKVFLMENNRKVKNKNNNEIKN